MSDRFFAEIKDERERACLEACWRAEWPDSLFAPEDMATSQGDREARQQVAMVLYRQVRPFLAMHDAAQQFPLPARERHR